MDSVRIALDIPKPPAPENTPVLKIKSPIQAIKEVSSQVKICLLLNSHCLVIVRHLLQNVLQRRMLQLRLLMDLDQRLQLDHLQRLSMLHQRRNRTKLKIQPYAIQNNLLCTDEYDGFLSLTL